VLVVGSPGSPLVERAREDGLAVAEFAVGGGSWLNPFLRRRLVRLFREQQVETVIFNGPADLKTGGLAARSAEVTRRIYRRGLALPVRDHPLNRHLFTRVLTHVIANSEETKRTLFKELGPVIPEERVAVISNGIDLAAFDRRPYRPVFRAPEGRLVLGTVGRLTRQKNQSLLLDVARLLADQEIPFHLLVAGSGELEVDLREKAVRLGLDDRVEFLGFLEDVQSFMKGIDLFVLPSSWEGFGYVVVEAGAARRPTVAFDISSNPEVVVDGVTGFLVEPGDVEGFAARIRDLAEHDGLRTGMGEAARRDVEARFTQDRAMDRLEAFLGIGGEAG
jgi:glycosyltransferase involved in cell wall biosynthesis